MTAKSTPRERGTGGLYRRGSDGMWCATLELPGVGEKRRRKVIVRAKRSDAVAALRAARKDLERSGDLATASPTLATWLDLWFERVATPRLKVSTRASYRSKIDQYIVPSIGRVRLDKLTATHVYRLHEYVMKPAPAGLGLSPSTALQAHRILAKALTDAMREDRITRNVATLVDAPRKPVSKVVALDADQARTLLQATAEDPDQAARWAVALLTGMRMGERLGLTHDQVDFDRGLITVSWQLQRIAYDHGCGRRTGDTWPCGRRRGGNCPQRHLAVPPDQEVIHLEGGLYLTRPKSRAGWREVPMAPLLAQVLERYVAARPAGVHGLIFTRDGDRPIDPTADNRAWDAALRAAGLPDVVGHSARHTCATLLLELGVPEPVRVAILGHSSATVTAGYTHVADPLTRDAMNRLGGLLGPRELEG